MNYSSLLHKNSKISKKDLSPLIYPALSEIKKNNLRGIYLGNYVLWDAKKQTEDMIQQYKYETMIQQRTHNNYRVFIVKIMQEYTII